MGQRHQVYAFVKDPERAFGMHHQWLFGRTAARQAVRTMQLATRANEWENPFKTLAQSRRAIMAVYSYIPELGYSADIGEGSLLEPGVVENPILGDNNDGITVFDFEDLDYPAYCMMSLPRGIECDSSCEAEVPPLTPLTVAQYVGFYYPDTDNAYWKQVSGPKGAEKNAEAIRKVLAECEELRLAAFDFKVISQARLREMFPKMFSYKPPKR